MGCFTTETAGRDRPLRERAHAFATVFLTVMRSS